MTALRPARHPRLLLLAALLAGATGLARAEAPAVAGHYAGTLPCADCEGIAYRLDLNPDGSYFLSTRYLGKAEPGNADELGRWTWASDNSLLALLGGAAPRLFAVPEAGALDALDGQGAAITTSAPHRLSRDDSLAPVAPHLATVGVYRHGDEGASFTECASGRQYPVATSAAYNVIDLAYKRRARKDGEPLMARIEGRIETRAAADGQAPLAMVVVENFDGFRAGVACPPPAANLPLTGTRWLPTQLALPANPVHQPHVILGAGGDVSGAGTCNRITGGYKADDKALHLENLATTRMACAEGQTQEDALLAALGATRRWRVVGNVLDLFDDKDQPVLRLEGERPR